MPSVSLLVGLLRRAETQSMPKIAAHMKVTIKKRMVISCGFAM